MGGSAPGGMLAVVPPENRPKPDPLATVARDFDLPSDVAYLNTAYMGPMPVVAMEAGLSGLARKGRPWTIAADDFTVPVHQLRATLAGLLGVPDDGEGVAITPSVSYGIATAAANVAVAPGQAVVVLDGQFPSDVYGWMQLVERTGGVLHTVARPADGDWTTAVLADLDRLGGRVAVLSCPPCHWMDGGVVDLARVAPAVRAVGAALVVDVTQWLGAAPFDVAALAPDYVVGAAYKWLCGPYSSAFCWVAPPHRGGEPIEHGWAARANSEQPSALATYTRDFHPGAQRFDVGEVANFALLPAALAAADLVASWGTEAVSAHARRLTDRVAAGGEALGLSVAPSALRAPHLVGLQLAPVADPLVVVPALADDGVHVSARGNSIRVSAHAYNTDDDVDRLLAALDKILGVGR